MLNSGPYIKRIEALEEENELLRYRLAEFEESFGFKDDIAPILALGFSPSQARIVNLLRRREFATRRQMLLAIYADKPDRALEITCNIASVFLAQMRPVMARLGLELRHNRPWGDGQHRYLSKEDRAKLEKLIEESKAALMGRARAA